MALLSSFGSNKSNGGGGGGNGLRSMKVSSESWADFHKKHRSRPTYVGSSANKRRANLSSGTMGRRASMGSSGGSNSSSGTAGSRIYGGSEGGSSSSSTNFDRRGSLSNGSQRRRSSMY